MSDEFEIQSVKSSTWIRLELFESLQGLVGLVQQHE